MDLPTFRKGLQARIGTARDFRPFVCDGDPMQCKAFVVGANPATKGSCDFWHFWDDEKGFDKVAWFRRYCDERAKNGKPISPTRERIAKIVGAASEVKILETNLFGVPTGKQAELRREDKQSSIFDFLLSSIAPKVILFHGAPAAAHFNERYGTKLTRDGSLSDVEIDGRSVRICASKHLSRVSYAAATRLGETVRAEAVG